METVDAPIRVRGELFTKMPEDLYIPPHALEVFLEAFEGPLDLLLYLIKHQNIDILDIPIAEVTRQYMTYIDLMKEMELELAAEYLVMAAMLAEIKSRMLLPKMLNEEGDEEDPRAELIRRLQEYERYKKAAESLDDLPRRGRDTFAAMANMSEPLSTSVALPDVDLQELLGALKEVLQRAALRVAHYIQREPLSVRERMTIILDKLNSHNFVTFCECFGRREGRPGAVVAFIAILELFRNSVIDVVQTEPFAPIHIRGVVR
jgi:segregation and condensation protein A